MEWDYFDSETILSSECISKKEILESINEVFNRKINIQGKNDVVFNKCLDSNMTTPHIKKQLKELKEFYYD